MRLAIERDVPFEVVGKMRDGPLVPVFEQPREHLRDQILTTEEERRRDFDGRRALRAGEGSRHEVLHMLWRFRRVQGFSHGIAFRDSADKSPDLPGVRLDFLHRRQIQFEVADRFPIGFQIALFGEHDLVDQSRSGG